MDQYDLYQGSPVPQDLTHGFVVNGEGKKISKSDGKPQTADSYVTKHGADVYAFGCVQRIFVGYSIV